MSPKEVDELPERHERADGVEEVFKGFDENAPLVFCDSQGIAFFIHEWADGKKFKVTF